MKIGVIGDDFTGSSDIALMLAQGGMNTIQYVGIPSGDASSDVDAGVISLKSRSCPVNEAIDSSTSAIQWLKAQGCKQFIFKYCSTFDSTPDGNIGPVIDALAEELDTKNPIIVCPAFPATGRTIYQGHLFVFDTLLSESGMQNHPLTPMTDPDIRRCLGLQTDMAIGHLPLNILRAKQGSQHLKAEAQHGRQYVVCDVTEDSDLIELAEATQSFELLTGGSGIAVGIPALYGKTPSDSAHWAPASGLALALSGSCSSTTLSQVEQHKVSGGAHYPVDTERLLGGGINAADIIEWATQQTTLPLISTSEKPEIVAALQQKFGVDSTANAIESFFAEIARLAIDKGFRSLICAGGETSGAIVQALNIKALEIGPMIDPGVPALRINQQNVTIALKSGNFGAIDFFDKAYTLLSQRERS